ncbi:MAG TPA: DUF72 domain-containing protein [Thermoanaerobaculia bacterium]|nr:DUF72 domain-containing protein [Thermoanaerobaculia bacterium]
MPKTTKIRIGPAGWSYKDWEGVVYPPHGSKFDHLAYLAQFFDTVEINSPFYRIPPPTHAKSWVRRVAANDDFMFTTKIYRGFTHETAKLEKEDLKAFRNYLDPLMDGSRLGAILIQFPWSFRNTPESREKLVGLFEAFREYPKALEVRHATFQERPFYEFLEEHDVSWVNVDQPLFSDSVKPADTVTGAIAYARLHGRNYEKWFAHQESWERYNYLYSERELEPWVERIGKMAKNKDTYVITNNHFRGQAILNAGDLKESLGQEANLPPQLKEAYPDRFG